MNDVKFQRRMRNDIFPILILHREMLKAYITSELHRAEEISESIIYEYFACKIYFAKYICVIFLCSLYTE